MKNINETKQKLMNITRQMIDNGGIDSVSMREIGREINLSRSAVYRHFTNKEDLLAAIVVENFEGLKSNICILIDEINDPYKLIKSILYAYYDFGIKNREHYNLMFTKEWDKEKYPEVYSVAYGIFNILENCIIKAQQKGLVINKPSNELMAMVFAYIHGLVQLNLAGHYEPEKGLNDAYKLINSFLSLIDTNLR